MVPARPKFRWESFSLVIRDALPTLQAFWDETEPHGSVYPFDMDFDCYLALERAGHLRIFVARDDDGVFLGAHFLVLRTTLRRRSVLHAINDCVIVTPHARGGWLGYKLIKGCENDLRSVGVKVMLIAPTSHYDLSPLLKRAGYVKIGGAWEKILEYPDGRLGR